jgi:hypothetical protein
MVPRAYLAAQTPDGAEAPTGDLAGDVTGVIHAASLIGVPGNVDSYKKGFY